MRLLLRKSAKKTPAQSEKWDEIFDALVREGHSEERAAKIAHATIKKMKKGGGEGSRGGHVVGHTKSGKPIYASSKTRHQGRFNSRKSAQAHASYLKERHGVDPTVVRSSYIAPGGHRVDEHEVHLHPTDLEKVGGRKANLGVEGYTNNELLSAIHKHGPMSVSDLRYAFGGSSSSHTARLKALVASGHLEKRGSEYHSMKKSTRLLLDVKRLLKADKRIPADYFRKVSGHNVPFKGTPGKGTQVGGFDYKGTFGGKKKTKVKAKPVVDKEKQRASDRKRDIKAGKLPGYTERKRKQAAEAKRSAVATREHKAKVKRLNAEHKASPSGLHKKLTPELAHLYTQSIHEDVTRRGGDKGYAKIGAALGIGPDATSQEIEAALGAKDFKNFDDFRQKVEDHARKHKAKSPFYVTDPKKDEAAEAKPKSRHERLVDSYNDQVHGKMKAAENHGGKADHTKLPHLTSVDAALKELHDHATSGRGHKGKVVKHLKESLKQARSTAGKLERHRQKEKYNVSEDESDAMHGHTLHARDVRDKIEQTLRKVQAHGKVKESPSKPDYGWKKENGYSHARIGGQDVEISVMGGEHTARINGKLVGRQRMRGDMRDVKYFKQNVEKMARGMAADSAKAGASRSSDWKPPKAGEHFDMSGGSGPIKSAHPAKAIHGNFIASKKDRVDKHGRLKGLKWSVTHGPSGLGLGHHATMKEAVEAAKHFHAHAGDAGHHWNTGQTTQDSHFDRLKDASDAWEKGDYAHPNPFGRSSGMKKAAPTGIPGVTMVNMRKGAMIQHVDEAILPSFTALTPPEIRPGTMLEDDRGRVLRGVFRIGPYECEYRKANVRTPAYVTMAGEVLPVPFHFMCKSWDEALTKAQEAAESFQKGQSPRSGVFRNVGAKVNVKYPGIFKE